MMIQSLPKAEQPRERCLNQGPESLSLRECLAVLFGSGPKDIGCLGLAQNVLDHLGSGMEPAELETVFFTTLELHLNNHSDFRSLSSIFGRIKGFGPASLSRLWVAIELGRRYLAVKESRKKINIKTNKYSFLELAFHRIPMKLRLEPKEWLGFVPVFSKENVGHLCIVEKGARTHVNTDPVELFARLLPLRPKGFFLFHNHPSGNLEPSQDDYELTEKMRSLSEKFSIPLLGHGIVSAGEQRWVDLVPI